MVDLHSERLSEYLDGELSPSERAQTEFHLETCADCRYEMESLRRVVAHLDEAVDHSPPRDLWPGVAEKIHKSGMGPGVEPSSARPRFLGLPWNRMVPVAASVMVVGILTMLWTVFKVGSGPRAPANTTAAVRLAQVDEAARESVEDYRAASTTLRDLLEQRDLPPELEPLVREELVSLDYAVQETLLALEEEPDDPELLQHLIRTLRAQLRFLRRVESSLLEVL